jgi:hypothetical protein
LEELELEPGAMIQRRLAEPASAPDDQAHRCDALAGHTVFYALSTFEYERNGEMVKYSLRDLRSDIEQGRIDLLAPRRPAPSQATPLASLSTRSSPSLRPFAERTSTPAVRVKQVAFEKSRRMMTMDGQLPRYTDHAWLQHSEYTQRQLERLQNHCDWLAGFEAFLRDETLALTRFGRQLPEYNVKTIMSGVARLESGRGYLHISANVYFRRNQPLTLDEDLMAVLDAQKAFFALHGRDTTCGWAIRYPIAKLLMYQRYVACGGHYQQLLRGER